MALANNVNLKTAYGWMRTYDKDALPKKRGGTRIKKITQLHVDAMTSYVEQDPLISLQLIKLNIFRYFQMNVLTTTIHKYLEGQFYSVKKVLPQPSAMNSAENKEKRSNYVGSVMESIGHGKRIVYIDETNCNLFLRCSFGRSKKGVRCTVSLPTSKGQNVHVIAGIYQTGLVYWERRRGSFRKDDCCEWLRKLLRELEEPIQDVVVACDNAPVHVSLQDVMEEEEFEGAQLLRLAPYSAPLNPIEECWSVMKSEIKKLLRSTMTDLLNATPPAGISQTEYRLRHLEDLIDSSICKITPTLCMKTCNHVQRHFQSCLALMDLNMGDICNQ